MLFYATPERIVINIFFFNTPHTVSFKTHLKEQPLNFNITSQDRCLCVSISIQASATQVLNKDKEGNVSE